jgi:hypothetical protein
MKGVSIAKRVRLLHGSAFEIEDAKAMGAVDDILGVENRYTFLDFL